MENQPTISSDLIRGHIDTIILHTLLESDKFAQQISDSVESKSENEYKINQATLYSSLKRLETLKLVSSYWHDFEDGRRKYFKITDEGKKTVENNLSSWTYSRSIIDKLMNLSPVPVTEFSEIPSTPAPFTRSETEFKQTETQNISVFSQENEKPIEKLIEKPVELPSNDENPIYEADLEVNSENDEQPAADNSVNTVNAETVNAEHERNFRNILNGLIQISAHTAKIEPEQTSEKIEPINAVSDLDSVKTVSDVQKFNETIDETDYNANKSNFNGKIDYGDLTLKGEKEGYLVRISSKDSAKPQGKLLINKLNFVVSALIFVIALAELGILYLAFSQSFGSTSVIILSGIPVIPCLIFGIIYFTHRDKLSKKKILPDGILTAAIAAFNLILVTFAVDFLFEIDFSNTTLLLAALLIPVIYYLDFVLFFALRFFLSPRKAFSYK